MRLRGAVWSVLCVWTAGVLHVTLAECPHEPTGKTLRRWTDENGWTSLGQTKPAEGAVVEISDDVLLDESPPELTSIEINAGGSLVFSPDGDYTLVVGFMMLHGALHIGSEDCKFTAKAKIILKARRGDFNVEGFGGKFIGVEQGATLELHGQNKLGWTKITSTIPKITFDNGLVYDIHEDDEVDNWNRGLVTIILNGTTGEMKFNKMIYLHGQSKWRLTHDPPAFFEAMADVQDGDVVVMLVQKNIVGTLDLEPFYDAIEQATLGQVTGTSAIRGLQARQPWVLVAVRGEFVKEKAETRMGEDQFITASLTVPLPQLDLVIKAESLTRPTGNEMWGRTVGQAAVMSAGARILTVVQDVTTWRPGDRVLVTSTDYDWRQAEEAEVTYCSPSDCQPNQVKVLMFPKYTHYGEITDGVDMRAEVALLSRNIVIEGHMEDMCPEENDNCKQRTFDTYGGHIKIEHGFEDVHIEGVELRHMGQLTDPDRHPIYFHMCHDVDTYANPAYVKSVSIKDSYNMCVVVSGTSGLTIQDNVAFNHFGHCYALKEGGEKRTVLDGNLGAGTKDHPRTNMDKQSTTFLITNPLTHFRNNIAAGGNRKGIWYVFPREPVGESAGLGLMGKDEARRTPYTQFTNNAAHSYGDGGLHIDHELRQNGNYGGSNNYSPVSDPSNRESEPQAVVLHRFTGFKNRWQNAHVRGGYFVMDQASLADSARGAVFAWSSNDMKVLQNSVVLGESANVGEPGFQWVKELEQSYYFPRSLPLSWDHKYPIQGFTIQDGPLRLKSVWFNSFPPNENRSASAIGFQPSTQWPSFPNNDVQDLQFGFDDGESTGLRMFESGEGVHAFGDKDGDLESILYDVDGSLTGVADSTLVKPFPVYTTSRCYERRGWGMAICPHHYGKLKIQANEGKNHRSAPVLTRDDLRPSQGLEMPHKAYVQYPVILGGSLSYILHWTAFLPQTVFITGRGIQRDEGVRLGLCVPRDGDINLYTYSPVWAPNIDRWSEVDTLQEIDQDTVGGKYFYDRTNGIVFVKLLNYDRRSDETMEECAGHCPVVRLQLKSGNASDADCRDRIGDYRRSATMESVFRLGPASLPATSRTPPVGLGSGEFLPFQTRNVVDGAYGEWSDWGPCTTTCGGGSQIRSRACDSPIPQNGGRPCSGPSEETQVCSTNPCEIHGNFTTWSAWSPCQSLPGNGDIHGYQERSRSCDDPAPRYNGDVCVGDTIEMQPCLLTATA